MSGSMAGDGFDPMLYAKYASLKNPDKSLNNDYVWHTPRSLVVYERFPKSKMHFKLIPRVGAPPRVPDNLKDLYTLLHSSEVGKRDAETILREMREDAEAFKPLVEEEMRRLNNGFAWNIWMGFKAKPSYKYLHMHILSDDLIGTGMKRPEHFFGFHPEHGDFYHIDEVLSWFEIVPERFKDNVRELGRKERRMVEDRPTREYECYYRDGGLECCFVANGLPTMKAHLENHWQRRVEDFKKRRKAREAFEKAEAERKARRAEAKMRENDGRNDMEVEPQSSPSSELPTARDD